MHGLIPPRPSPSTPMHTLGILSSVCSNPIHPSRSSSDVISSAGHYPLCSHVPSIIVTLYFVLPEHFIQTTRV